MDFSTQYLLELWLESRTRFSAQLPGITAADLKKRLNPSPNSAGFLIQHIGDVELLFAKNVFGASELKVQAKTVIEKVDTGEWTALPELLEYVNYSFESLQHALQSHQDADWMHLVVTKEFGSRTKAQALGRICSHTAYHAGQLAMILKYGTSPNP
jgi:uncharacterized damage-inducible protein DinB